MRTSDRVSVLLLSLLLTTVSCAPAPTSSVVEGAPRPIFEVDRNPRPEVVRAEAAEIARFLRDRETGLLPAEVVHLSRVIAVEARRAGLPPAFVLAVIDVESGSRNFAVSSVGARGLMQLLPATGEFVAAQIGVPWWGPDTLFDPAANVRLGVSYLVGMIDRYADLRTALAAYNWGPGQISARVRRGEVVPRIYADRVLAAYAGTGREI
jgi:soluble lytic murein transglycosylase-like protein